MPPVGGRRGVVDQASDHLPAGAITHLAGGWVCHWPAADRVT
jgi:hypothetical protein